ncbi:MAG: phosphomannomutase/phosphoglucomutase [Candidatus Pacebacteria bacterium]|nr:phosphomannomutase/phosphoglucomutase [Candidatus Paceibacterota bacterium]
MKINQAIFKAYDIRGKYPGEINKNSAFQIGKGFASFLKVRKPEIVVGRDNRLSSLDLFSGISKGVSSQGGRVINIGLSTTPMLYWACANFKHDGGIEITASHNPPEYNGFKLVKRPALPISEVSGLEEIKILAGKNLKEKKGNFPLTKKEVLKEYSKFNFDKFPKENFRNLKIVIDTANGVSGLIIPEISKKFPFKICHLFKKLDGSFPNHNPDPSKSENLISLQKEVAKRKADLGVAFDGDGDRIAFVNENGNIVPNDFILALLAGYLLRENPKNKILYDLRSSNIVREVISESGGTPVISRIGHSFIKEKMRKENILFGGELSGHFYHKDYYFCEAPIFVLLKICEILSNEKRKLSEIIFEFEKYCHSGEINFEIKDKEGKIREIKNRYQSGKIIEIDGLRVDFEDWWFLVRPSNTEPLLRLILEAKTKELLEEKRKELSDLIEN